MGTRANVLPLFASLASQGSGLPTPFLISS